MSLSSLSSRIPGVRPTVESVAGRDADPWIARFRGPLAVLTLVTFLETLSHSGLEVPQVELFLLLVVAYVAFVDGILPGLLGSAISVAYYAYSNSPAGRPFHTPVSDWEGLVIAGIAIPMLALLVGLLRKELRRATVRERETRERLSTVVENLSAGFVTFGEDGRVGYLNAHALDLLGVTDRRAVESRFWPGLERVLGDAAGRIERSVRNGVSDDFEARVVDTSRWWSVQIHPLPGGAALYVTDVTERKRLQDQIAGLRRAESIGQLAGGVAHDFNNLLTAIKGYNEIALSEAGPDDPSRASLIEVKKAAQRASELTRQLLAFSRQQVRQPRVLDLEDVVSDMRGILRRLVREDVEIRTDLDSGPVRADAGQLEQVVLNLVANASDAMPRGGRIDLETRRLEVREPIEREGFVVEAGKYVELVVRDTGHGMDAATRAKVFEPFFSTKARGEGTGLGLATVYGIVKQNRGYVFVDSEPGAGTTFRVWLPESEEGPVPETAEEATPVEPEDAERATILLVEDEPSVRRLGARILRSDGHDVIEAADGAEALQACRGHDGPIDLLFTDIVMPKVSGRELARALQERQPGLVVVYTSGYTNEDNVGAGIDRGVLEPGIHFIHKPYTPDELVGRIREALRERPVGAPAG